MQFQERQHELEASESYFYLLLWLWFHCYFHMQIFVVILDNCLLSFHPSICHPSNIHLTSITSILYVCPDWIINKQVNKTIKKYINLLMLTHVVQFSPSVDVDNYELDRTDCWSEFPVKFVELFHCFVSSCGQTRWSSIAVCERWLIWHWTVTGGWRQTADTW